MYQRIDVVSRELDNIVDLNIPTPWPLPTIQVTATLAHSFELTGKQALWLGVVPNFDDEKFRHCRIHEKQGDGQLSVEIGKLSLWEASIFPRIIIEWSILKKGIV